MPARYHRRRRCPQIRPLGPVGFALSPRESSNHRQAGLSRKPPGRSRVQKNGWQHYFNGEITNYAPHYEAYLWACFLWAYHKTRYQPFLERARNAIRMTIAAYPDGWHWTNGIQQERARMLLPAAWLVRVEDTPKHREWLRKIAAGLLAFQESCGAMREEIGTVGKGKYAPPKSNQAYGTAEAPLIQENGDPLTDL